MLDRKAILTFALLFPFFLALSVRGEAFPFGQRWAPVAQQTEALIERVHGFHCRPEVGWDPSVGYYRLHSHPKICQDYNRCVGVHKKCLRTFARGWDNWEYERWGWNNWKYTACMFKYECY